MKIDVVIPNYNGTHLIKKNLPSVITALANYNAQIIIVDDYSQLPDFEELKKYIDSITGKNFTISLLRNTKNLGFSPTVNKGVKSGNGELIVLLNSDVRPEADFFDYAVPHFSNDFVFAVGCMDRSIENGKEVLRGRGIGKWQRGMLVHSRGDVSKNTTLWVSGGSSVFRRSLWETLGGLNELYSPFYWEDIDLSYRAQKAGYDVIFENKSMVIHEHEEGAIKKTRSEFDIKKISYCNQFIFVWLNVSDVNLIISHILWLPYHVLNGIVKGEWALVVGLCTALGRLQRILASRSKIQRLRKKTDREVITAVQS